MVLPFFGRKSPDGGKTEHSTQSPDRSHKGDMTTSLDFTHAGGDGGRSLAATAEKIQVLEVSHEDVAAIEEAAVLYANANESGAKAVLEEAVNGLGKKSDRIWKMLFDLYRLIGDKQSFDTQGVVFAQLFEKSPPVWKNASLSGDNSPLLGEAKPGNTPAVNLGGNLNSSAQNQFEQLTRIATRTGKLRIDLSRLRGIDDAGCELFYETLYNLKKAKVKISMQGVAHALTLLEPNLKVGEAEGRIFWMVSLVLLQQLGDQERFEDAAVNFAITFEESPPSWDPSEVTPDATETQDLQKTEEAFPTLIEEDSDRFTLEGVVAGPQPEILQKMAVYAAERSVVEVDCSELRRLEFVSAGSLFNQIAQFQSKSKRTVLHHPNEMVAALLVVMGIDQISDIEHKKF